jgi:hypothetical protein
MADILSPRDLIRGVRKLDLKIRKPEHLVGAVPLHGRECGAGAHRSDRPTLSRAPVTQERDGAE